MGEFHAAWIPLFFFFQWANCCPSEHTRAQFFWASSGDSFETHGLIFAGWSSWLPKSVIFLWRFAGILTGGERHLVFCLSLQAASIAFCCRRGNFGEAWTESEKTWLAMTHEQGIFTSHLPALGISVVEIPQVLGWTERLQLRNEVLRYLPPSCSTKLLQLTESILRQPVELSESAVGMSSELFNWNETTRPIFFQLTRLKNELGHSG